MKYKLWAYPIVWIVAIIEWILKVIIGAVGTTLKFIIIGILIITIIYAISIYI